MAIAGNLSHGAFTDTEIVEQRIVEAGERIEVRLKMLEELLTFPFGEFLLKHKGIDGYWTDYAIHRKDDPTRCELEEFILERAPVVLATRERATIFQQELQKLVNDNVTFVSCPSGLMRDLLSLDLSHHENVSLIGVDIEMSPYMDEVANHYEQEYTFYNQDAWNLNLKCDVLTSSGLNIYVKEEEKVLSLYQSFYNSLNEGGTLITSFMTPPTEWDMSQINLEDLARQKELMVDVVQANFNHFRTTEETKNQLKKVGFTSIEIIKDKANIFPTVVATK